MKTMMLKYEDVLTLIHMQQLNVKHPNKKPPEGLPLKGGSHVTLRSSDT